MILFIVPDRLHRILHTPGFDLASYSAPRCRSHQSLSTPSSVNLPRYFLRHAFDAVDHRLGRELDHFECVSSPGCTVLEQGGLLCVHLAAVLCCFVILKSGIIVESGATVQAWKRLLLACRRWSVLLLSFLRRDRRDEEICDPHCLLLRFVVWMIRTLV